MGVLNEKRCKIDKSLSEDEKRIILFDIYDLINEKDIKKIYQTRLSVLHGEFMMRAIYYIILQIVVFFQIKKFMSIQNYY